MSLLIYTHAIAPRVRYAVQTLVGDMLGIEFALTDDRARFLSHEGPRMSYTHLPLADELHLSCHRLLWDKGIDEQAVALGMHGGTVTLFSHRAPGSALPFDPFAGAFYLLTRYEEYLPHRRDHYGRFEAQESVAFQNGFLHDPVVDRWVIMLGALLRERYPQLPQRERRYSHINTLDIDNAYAFRLKGLARTVGAMARDVAHADMTTLRQRSAVLMGRGHDPYDTYEYILDRHASFGARTIIFFLLGDYGLNDKNVAHDMPGLRSLIKHLADHVEVGIHPSFASNSGGGRMLMEKQRLEAITHRPVTASRQHFLVLHMPHTYRRLVQAGITDDHSMGYAASTGFRAGTCTAYRHYDLDLEAPTPLTVHPFVVMDATLRYYMKLTPEQSMEHISALNATVREVKGTFITLWHNETLSDEGIWAQWRQVYDHLMRVGEE
jgi:hypothetical protein